MTYAPSHLIRLALLSGIPRIPPNPKVIFQILNSHEKLHKTLKPSYKIKLIPPTFLHQLFLTSLFQYFSLYTRVQY